MYMSKRLHGIKENHRFSDTGWSRLPSPALKNNQSSRSGRARHRRIHRSKAIASLSRWQSSLYEVREGGERMGTFEILDVQQRNVLVRMMRMLSSGIALFAQVVPAESHY